MPIIIKTSNAAIYFSLFTEKTFDVKSQFRRNMELFAEELDAVHFIDDAKESGMLSEGECDSIMSAQPVTRRKRTTLMLQIIGDKGADAIGRFKSILEQKGKTNLAERLQQSQTSAGIVLLIVLSHILVITCKSPVILTQPCFFYVHVNH